MLSSEDRFNIIKQSIAGQIEGPAYEAIQAAEQESLQANTEEAPQSEQQTQIPQTPVGPPPAQTIPRVYDQLGSLIEPGSTGVGLNQMAGTSPGQTIQPGEYKTGGIKDGDITKYDQQGHGQKRPLMSTISQKINFKRLRTPEEDKVITAFTGLPKEDYNKLYDHMEGISDKFKDKSLLESAKEVVNLDLSTFKKYRKQVGLDKKDILNLISAGKKSNFLERTSAALIKKAVSLKDFKTGGPKSKAPKPLTESDAKLEKEWPLMLQKQRFVESGFNTNAKSSKGATGSAQIMPDTLDYAKMKGWVPETISMKDLTGAEGYSISKHIQEKYMDNLFNRSWNKGTNEAKKAKALLAYNWGPENTRVKLNKLIDQGVNVWDNTDFTKHFNEESRQYKGKILDDLTTKKDPYVQRDYKKLKDLSPLLRMHGGPKVLYNNKKLKK